MDLKFMTCWRALWVLLVASFWAAGSASSAQGQSGPAEAQVAATEASRAQEPTRAERLRAARRAKAEQLEEPEQPGFVERTMASLDGRFGGSAPGATGGFYGIRPVLGGIRAGAGPTAGIRFDPTRGRDDLLIAADVRASVRGYWSARVVGGYDAGALSAYLLGRHRHMPREPVYGIGPDTRLSDRWTFRLNETVAGGLLAVRGPRPVHVGLQASYQGYRTDGGPSSAADYVVAGAFGEFDTRDVPQLPEFGSRYSPAQHELRGLSLDARRGVFLSLEAARFAPVAGGEPAFTRAGMDAQQFIPIRHGYQVLALRQAATLTWSESQLPVYLMPSLGGSRSLRGFDSFRFRGANAWLVNAEYRWYVWLLLDFALFMDAGRVMHELSDFGFDDLETSYGAGVRLKSPSRVLGRIDVARSREGVRVWVKIGSFI